MKKKIQNKLERTFYDEKTYYSGFSSEFNTYQARKRRL